MNDFIIIDTNDTIYTCLKTTNARRMETLIWAPDYLNISV